MGQALNVAVFNAIGGKGVYYGYELGYKVLEDDMHLTHFVSSVVHQMFRSFFRSRFKRVNMQCKSVGCCDQNEQTGNIT